MNQLPSPPPIGKRLNGAKRLSVLHKTKNVTIDAEGNVQQEILH